MGGWTLENAPPTQAAPQPQSGWTLDDGTPVAPTQTTPALDKYKQEAQDFYSDMKKAGADPAYGATESALNGLSLGAYPMIMGALTTPVEMYNHGTWNVAESYRYAKALQDTLKQKGDEEQPYMNMAAGIAGAGLGGAGLAEAGVTAVPAAQSILGRVLGGVAGGAVDGAGQGALYGALSSPDGQRTEGAEQDAMVGGALGAGVHAAGSVLSGVGSGIKGLWDGNVNPDTAARTKVAQMILSSGQSPDVIRGALQDAANSGQTNYMLADALGKAGQSAVAHVTNNPGEAKNIATEFLTNRQADAGRDVINQVNQGFDIPTALDTGQPYTAQTYKGMLEAQRRVDAAANYGAARAQATPVDVNPVIDMINERLTPKTINDPNVNNNLPPSAIAQTLAGIKSTLTNAEAGNPSPLVDFSRGFDVKRNMDFLLSDATRNNDGGLVAALTPVRDALDNQLAEASDPYTYARDTHKQQSGPINAVDFGKAAATRGRVSDNIAQFNALPDADSQKAFSIGYVDPLLTKVENNAALGADKTRPFMSLGAQQEIRAMIPDADNLYKALARNSAMTQTYNRALNGSMTAANLAENAEHGAVDPGAAVEALKGNWLGLALDMGRKAVSRVSGSTPQYRQALWNYLSRTANAPGDFGDLQTAISQVQRQKALAKILSSGAAAAPTPLINPSLSQR